MTNPWDGLVTAPGDGDLHLDPEVKKQLDTAFNPYNEKLQALIDDALDDTNGYFGSDSNRLASRLESAFNGRGKVLSDYVKEQQRQANALMTTAQQAATTQEAHDKS